jgi:hypothetical protein
VGPHSKEGSGELDFGCLEPGVRIPERDFRGMGRSPGRVVRRQVQRRPGSKGGILSDKLQEQEG